MRRKQSAASLTLLCDSTAHHQSRTQRIATRAYLHISYLLLESAGPAPQKSLYSNKQLAQFAGRLLEGGLKSQRIRTSTMVFFFHQAKLLQHNRINGLKLLLGRKITSRNAVCFLSKRTHSRRSSALLTQTLNRCPPSITAMKRTTAKLQTFALPLSKRIHQTRIAPRTHLNS